MQQVDLYLGYATDRGKIRQPEAILRKKLDWESGTPQEGKGEFYNTLRNAWDALAYGQYEIGTLEESLAGTTLSQLYQHRRATGTAEPAVIRLSSPEQVKMLDAMADACEIPHVKGQREFRIPEKCVNRLKWVTSAEYEQAFLRNTRAKP